MVARRDGGGGGRGVQTPLKEKKIGAIHSSFYCGGKQWRTRDALSRLWPDTIRKSRRLALTALGAR